MELKAIMKSAHMTSLVTEGDWKGAIEHISHAAARLVVGRLYCNKCSHPHLITQYHRQRMYAPSKPVQAVPNTGRPANAVFGQ